MTSNTTPALADQLGDRPENLRGTAVTIALIVVLFASFMDLLDATIVTVAAPSMASELNATPAQLQWILAAYVLALGSGLITGGRLGDDYGRRRVFLASLTGFAVASAACALATGPSMLIFLRVLQGLAGGLMVPQVFGIIRSSFDHAGMAKAFGAYGAVQGLAAVAGPLLGGFLVAADIFGLGWRAVFWVNVPIACVALVLGWRVLPESTNPKRGRLDVVGALLSSGAVLLVLLPVVQGRDWGWPWWGVVLMAVGITLLGGFVRYEQSIVRRGGQPLLDPALLRVRSFSAGLLASICFFGAIGAFFLTLSIYLQSGTGRSAWETGLVMLPYAIGSIVTSGVGVALAGRAGRWLLVSGSLILAASNGLLWFFVRDGQDPGYWALAVGLFVGGLGLGLAAPVLVNVILSGIPARDAGAAGGVLSTVNQVGGAAGIAALGTIFFAAVDRSSSGSTPLQVFGDAFAVVLPFEVVLYLVAAGLMLLLPRTTS